MFVATFQGKLNRSLSVPRGRPVAAPRRKAGPCRCQTRPRARSFELFLQWRLPVRRSAFASLSVRAWRSPQNSAVVAQAGGARAPVGQSRSESATSRSRRPESRRAEPPLSADHRRGPALLARAARRRWRCGGGGGPALKANQSIVN